MRFLGGDAVHSVLVRGLDYSLLAQHKAKAEGTNEVTDDDLEQAYAQAAHTNGSLDRQAEGSSSRRSRADILASLKKDRAATGSNSPIDTSQDRETDAQQARDEELERAKRMGKFRPIGFQEVKNSKDDDVIITKDGKRLRKKKKKVQPEEPEQAKAAQATSIPPKKPVIEQPKVAAPTSSTSRPSQKSMLIPPKVKNTSAKPLQKVEASPPATTSTPTEATEPPSQEHVAAVQADEDTVLHGGSSELTAGAAITAPVAPDEDSDDDIFAGAAQYTGFVDSDDNEDEEQSREQAHVASDAKKDPPPTSSSTTLPKKDWFAETKSRSEGAEVDATPSTSSADPRVSSILASLRAGPSSTTDNQSHNAQKRVDAEESALPRLQGLSGSSLSNEHMKMMLQREKDEAQREKERSEWWKKKKNKGGKGKLGGAEAEEGAED